jgi:cytochrome P450
MENPNDFVHHIARYACSVVSIVGYGRRLASIEDPVAKIALATMEGVDLVIPCSSIVETIPWTQHLPKWLYTFPAKARAGSAAAGQYFDRLVKEAASNGRTHFSQFLIDGQKEFGINEGEVHNLTANLIGGGVDTTSSSIISFIFAMCVFPEVQRKAQIEIDRIVGRERSPSWEDLPKLDYCTACVSETLRWRTVTILGGIPHAPIQNDEYRGYHIPAGTAITGNVWAIHRHPREFPAPDSFRPERYLGGLERPYPTKQGHSAFGWGRRTCSGQPFAEQSLKSVIARLLWAFDIRPGLDKEVSFRYRSPPCVKTTLM